MASLHKPTPVDSQEEAAASQSAAATANGALPGGFQAPAGFVLKGVPSAVLAMTLCIALCMGWGGWLLMTMHTLHSALLSRGESRDIPSSECVLTHNACFGSWGVAGGMQWCPCDTLWPAGTAGRGGTIGPGKLPRRGDLGDVKYILQEVCTLGSVAPSLHDHAVCESLSKRLAFTWSFSGSSASFWIHPAVPR